jgi:probable O-glycosylation ligase (exosortase A-associated)
MPAERARDESLIGRLDGTGPLFFLYLTVLLIEFLGIPTLLPILKVTRFSTLSVYLLFFLVLRLVGSEAFKCYRLNRLMTFFVVFTAATVVYAVVNSPAFIALRAHGDYFAFFVVTAYLVDRPSRVRQFAMVGALIVIGLVARNIDALSSGSRQAGFAGAAFLGDGNDFAWGLCVFLPLCIYLAVTKTGLLKRVLGLTGIAAGLFGVVGTQSRGATLALATIGLFYWVFLVKRKALGVVALACILAAVVVLAPPQYFERMESIQNYQEDNSAQGRLQAWGAAIRMAIDFPLGVGASNFSSAYGRYYIPKGDANALTWGSGRWLSAHSVYFRILGEYGVLGLIWFFIVLSTTFRENMATAGRLAAGAPLDSPPPVWPLFVNMSLIGYAVAGIFLGGLTYPYLYIITGLTVSATRQSFFGQHQVAVDTTSVGKPLNARVPVSTTVIRSPQAAPDRPVLDVAARARMVVNSRPSRG